MPNPSKEKRKEKPKGTPQSRAVYLLKRYTLPVVGAFAFFILALYLKFGSQNTPAVDPLKDAIHITAPAFPALTLELNLTEQAPQSPMNRWNAVSYLQGDLAWDKPTFASSSWQDGYPSRATNGPDTMGNSDMWRSAGSTGSWLYVDLGAPTSFTTVISTAFVDTSIPETYYIVSDDLKTWRVVYDEINADNKTMRWIPRVITLPQTVTARYVGLYAQNWDGGWGDLHLFAVLP
jgi:hypothetical protein